MKRIYLIRHAESEGNVQGHLIGGRSDHVELTQKGHAQARALGRRLQDEPVGTILCSTAVRAKQTLVDVLETLDRQPPIIYDERLCERSQGEWTGESRAERYTSDVLVAMNRNPLHFRAPGGESATDVQERITGCLLDSLERTKTLWAFSHGYAIKAYLQKVMGFDPALTWKVAIDNASITCLKIDERGWFVDYINDFAHTRRLL